MTQIRFYFLTFIATLLISGVTIAQNSSSFYNTYTPFNAEHANNLSFKIENATFFQNNEFEDPLVEGYTLTGYWVRPAMEYYFNNKLRLTAGINLLKYNGVDNYSETNPWFSFHYKATPNLDVVFGNLDNSYNHNLPEPMFEPERFLTDQPEGGIQFLYNSDRFSGQTWINWEQFIFHDDPFQEIFTYGLSAKYKFFDNDNVSLSIPIHAVIVHHGGEIDSSDDNVESLANKAGGLSLDWEVVTENNLNFTLLYMDYDNMSSSKLRAYDSGKAFLFSTNYQTRQDNISLSFWHADKFIAPRGRHIYQSVYPYNSDLTVEKRKLVHGRYSRSFSIFKGGSFNISADLFYDIDSSKISHTYGFHLIINEDFFIKKIVQK
ncbi:hypothetical protein EYV94_24475 [Puteibacter caeruleilacunae]|nr:hypothetical protein EYV94_24475 [Puteibacter caeruleilacunae]